jgi:hypothetical protein
VTLAAVALAILVLAALARHHPPVHHRRAPAPAAMHHPQTFYVATAGRDSGRGTSPGHPWRTVARVDRARLQPGDTVLFRGGEAFSDAVLMPGHGTSVSGSSEHAITFSSYGRGRARLPRGIWLGPARGEPHGPSHLVFENLALGPLGGFQGTGSFITLRDLLISDLISSRHQNEVAIETEGSHWLIEHNTIERTGDSGMLLGFGAGHAGAPPGGYDYRVLDNTILGTGLDRTMTFGTHGIYLKVADALVQGNTIRDFHDDGISVRYRSARIVGNRISGGGIGIGFFQYDRARATSVFAANTITDTTTPIFVCGVIEHCEAPLERFVIRANHYRHNRGANILSGASAEASG